MRKIYKKYRNHGEMISEYLKRDGYKKTPKQVEKICNDIFEMIFQKVLDGHVVMLACKGINLKLGTRLYIGSVKKTRRGITYASSIHDPVRNWTFKVTDNMRFQYHGLGRLIAEQRHTEELKRRINIYDYYIKYKNNEEGIIQEGFSGTI